MPRVLLTDTPLFVDALRRDTGLPEGVLGWVLIVGGLAAAATFAVVSTTADDKVREGFGPRYDAIMRWLSGR